MSGCGPAATVSVPAAIKVWRLWNCSLFTECFPTINLQIIKEGDADDAQVERAKTMKPGALWHIFKAADTDKIRKLILKVGAGRAPRLSADWLQNSTWWSCSLFMRRVLLITAPSSFIELLWPGDCEGCFYPPHSEGWKSPHISQGSIMKCGSNEYTLVGCGTFWSSRAATCMPHTVLINVEQNREPVNTTFCYLRFGLIGNWTRVCRSDGKRSNNLSSRELHFLETSLK